MALAGACAASAGAADPVVQVHLTTPDLVSRVAREPDVQFRPGPAPASTLPRIVVDPTQRYQSFIGAGAALTDTSAWLIHDELTPSVRDQVLRTLFGRDGARLSFLRVPAGGSDFTAGATPYSYDDLPAGQADPDLRSFSIAHDLAYVLPTLRAILELQPSIYTLASPWSAPAWMKTNDALGNDGNLGSLRPGLMSTYANYLVRFLQAYAADGVRIDGLTPQNEPSTGTSYPGMNLSEPAEASFVSRYLAPALRRAGQAVSVFGFDLGWARNSLPYARRLERDAAAAQLAGIASHCYLGTPTAMSDLHRVNPRLAQIVSECSPGITPFSTSELLISSLRNWAAAVDAVEPRRRRQRRSGPATQYRLPQLHGPGHDRRAAMVSRCRRSISTSSPSSLGSRHPARCGSARRTSSTTPSCAGTPTSPRPGLDDVAVQNPDGTIVLLVYDNSLLPAGFTVNESGESFPYLIAPGAVATFTWRSTLPNRARGRP